MIATRLKSLLPKKARVSYAQCGEDLIVQFIFEALRLPKPTYLDLGAHHPRHMSNTFLFYTQGARGVCVEPDPTLYAHLKRVRPHDMCLNVGVGASSVGHANFYIMTSKALNTFSWQEAERYQRYGNQKIEQVIQVPVLSVNEIINQYCKAAPQFISVDVEGLDLEIVKSLNFDTFRPAVLCVETLTYTEDRTERKLTEIADVVCDRGYFLYADTYINSIFVDREAWTNRR
jgi:FkbM family methyltransferase